MERLHWLERRVNISEIFGLHVAGFVIDVRLDYAVSNSLILSFNLIMKYVIINVFCFLVYLCHDKLGINSRIELKFLRNTIQRDFRIGQTNHFHACLDHIVSQSKVLIGVFKIIFD